jgi:hypothetical protein
MTEYLKNLIEAARKGVPTSREEEEQRRGFAYGNTNMENPLITREMVDREAESLGTPKKLLPPLRGDYFYLSLLPTARAVGCTLSPLRGWSVEQYVSHPDKPWSFPQRVLVTSDRDSDFWT